MSFKHFYSKHQAVLYVILVALLLAVIVALWPRPKVADVIEPPKIKPQEIEVVEEKMAVSEPASTPVPTPIPPRYGFKDDDIYLMAVLLSGSKYVDGDGEFDIDYGRDDEYDQISLVLATVMNRVQSNKWPNTVSKVIWAPGQFSTMPQWKNGLPEVSDISLKRVKEWCKAYDSNDIGAQTIPENHFYFSGDGKFNYSR